MLQKISESLEYQDLFQKAAASTDPVLRLMYIATYQVACYTSTKDRVTKPFNSLLGETFDLIKPDFKAIFEQVSHHPPISALHAKATDNSYELWSNAYTKTTFWGASLEVVNYGTTHISLPRHKELYSLTRPSTNVKNILMG
jgi:hypothetical protein